MCQPRSEGGRRCPIHRHDSVAYIQLAEKDTELNKRQVENIFRELSREGRHTPDPTEEQWRALLTTFKTSLDARNGHRSIKNNVTKAFDNFSVPDGKTYYALQKLQESTVNKAEKLNNLFAQIAMEKGMPIANVKRRFNRYSNAVDISRGAGTPEGYSQQAYLYAKNNNLPYDKSSVVAIQQLRDLPVQRDDVHRVIMNEINTPNSTVTNIGYNSEGGRVELKLRSGNDRIFAYHNVPEEEWNEVFNNGTVNNAKLREMMSNEDYKYSNESDESLDRYNIHCESCGQFASPVSHNCPERAAEDELTIPLTVVSADEEIRQADATDSYREEFAILTSENNLRLEEAAAELAPVEENVTDTPVTEAIVIDPNAYNPAEPTRVNQIDNALSEVTLQRSDLESTNGLENRNARYSYEIYSNRENLFIYSERELRTTDFNGFEDELRADLTNVPVLSIVVQQVNLYYPYETLSKIIHVDRSTKLVNVDKTTNTIKIKKIHDDVKSYDPSISFTAEERNEASSAMYDSGLPIIANRASYTQSFIYDATLVTQPKVRIPKISDLKKAMRENDEFYIPIEMDNDVATALSMRRGINDGSLAIQDDQGYRQVYSNYRYNNSYLNGKIKYKKQNNGEFKAVIDPKLIACHCSNWRAKKYCEHVDNLSRRADNFLQQSIKPRATGRTRVDLSALPNARYLTAALSRRTDLTITPPNTEDGTELNYTFTEFNSVDRSRRRFNRWYQDRIGTLGYLTKIEADDFNSFETFLKAKEIASASRQLRSITTIEDIKPLLKACLNKKGTVTVPFKANYSQYYYGNANNVTGTVTYARDEDGKTYVKGDNLQCDCEDYREDYRCKHVILTANYARFVENDEQEVDNLRNSTDTLRHILSEDTNDNVTLYTNMQEIYNNLSPEEKLNTPESELRTRASDMIAERERQAAIEREREARARAERAERQRELNRERNERRARDLEIYVNSWKDENPERAAAIVAYRENMMSKWENVEPSYTNNPELAKTAIQEALDRKTAGENPIVFRESGVLDGMSDGPAGRKFGIELEFDVPPSNRRATLQKIGQELHEAGLTTTAAQQRYHSAGNNGYATWSYEEDCTVDAELVSPILDDSPESWEQVRKATEIITRNGGKATTRAGSHVHISTGSYENSSAKRAELLRFNREHQDMVYRLASDPKRGTHRGWQWCAPNVDDHGGEITDETNASTYLFSGDHGSHNVGLNLSAMGTNLTSSNVEFRFWDATLDAGAIQAQVMMSAAMTDYAERTVIKEKKTLVRESVKDIGSAALDNKDRHDLSGDTGFASFVDKLFRKDEDKSQIASLFAVTNWQKA